MQPILEVRRLSLFYKDLPCLKSVNLSVFPGDVICIFGKSGSGKSSLLRCLSALQEFEQGQILLDQQLIIENGIPQFAEWEINQAVSLVSQVSTLLPHLSILENILIGLRYNLHLDRSSAFRVAEPIIEALGLRELLSRFPSQVSGGEAQRAQLARVLVLNPKILLLDEITAHVDSETAQAIEHILSDRKEKLASESAMIIVTHSIALAQRLSTREFFLELGELSEYSQTDNRLVINESGTKQFLQSLPKALGRGSRSEIT